MNAAHADSFFAVHRDHVVIGLIAWAVVVAVSVLRARRDGAGDGKRTAGSRWVSVAAGASVVAAVVHFAVTGEHFRESLLYGWFFLVLGVAQLAWSVGVLLRPSRWLLLTGASGSLAVVALWLVTRTIAIPLGPAAGTTEPFGLHDVVCAIAELLMAVAGSAYVVAASADKLRSAARESAPAPR